MSSKPCSYGKGCELINIPVEETGPVHIRQRVERRQKEVLFHTTLNYIVGLLTGCCKGQKCLSVKWDQTNPQRTGQ